MAIKDKRTSHQEFKKKALKNPDVRKEYDRLKPVYEAIRSKMRKMQELQSISDSPKKNL